MKSILPLLAILFVPVIASTQMRVSDGRNAGYSYYGGDDWELLFSESLSTNTPSTDFAQRCREAGGRQVTRGNARYCYKARGRSSDSPDCRRVLR